MSVASVSAQIVASETTDSIYDRIWRHGVLYENQGKGFVQRFALSGRLQAEAAWFDADEGSFDDLTWRRFRFGFVADFAQGWKVHLEADFDLNESADDAYQGLTDTYIGWRPDDTTQLKILKQSVGFTLDGATSSKNLLTLQRNNLTENLWFTEEYFTGISLASEFDPNVSYKVGFFASDGAREIGVTDASYFGLASVGYDLAVGLDEASIRLDYVYNDKDEKAFTKDMSHVVSLSSVWRQGAWNLHTDFAAGDGYFDQSDIWGIVVMPYYDVTAKLQMVGRYTYLSSDDDNGLTLNRYEASIADGRGDEYHEFYVGVNLFFYGHKLKWQTGLQYARMDDGADDGGKYKGWGLTTGLRISW